MMLKNDQEKRWVNGSLGTIDRITDDAVLVKIDGSAASFEVSPAVWEQYKYTWNEAAETIENKRIGAYSQLPMKLAWASTIHKAQGLSLADVRIDMGRGAFERGQAYVALSRATTAAGLSLVRPLLPADIMIDSQMPQQLAQLKQRQSA
jgi:ATP-dependent exoDNAse (exonuclease V) alpha subunit